jgi:hypothetical protein
MPKIHWLCTLTKYCNPTASHSDMHPLTVRERPCFCDPEDSPLSLTFACCRCQEAYSLVELRALPGPYRDPQHPGAYVACPFDDLLPKMVTFVAVACQASIIILPWSCNPAQDAHNTHLLFQASLPCARLHEVGPKRKASPDFLRCVGSPPYRARGRDEPFRVMSHFLLAKQRQITNFT